MAEENISHEFRLKNKDETRNYLTKEINQNELMIKKHKKVCTTLNYIEHFLILGSTITGCVCISGFASLAGIPIGITSSTTGLSQHKSTIKKKKKHNKIVFLAKYKLNSREFLISKALIDSVINHDEFVLINNVLKKYNKMKEEIKNSNKKKSLKYI